MQKYDSYKDSGIEWIGEIPSHWEVMPFKHVCKNEQYAIKTGPFGSQLKGEELMADGDVVVYNQRNVIDDDFSTQHVFVTKEKAKSLSSFMTKPNDLLITSRGTIGKCSILKSEMQMGILHPCLIALRINPTICEYEWARLFINESQAFKINIFLNSNATTIEVIYTDTIKNVNIPMPSVNEQKQLLKYLYAKCSKIDNLISTQQKRVELLKELKQSVITRAVTRGINLDVKMKDSGVEWIGEVPEHWEVIKEKYLMKDYKSGPFGSSLITSNLLDKGKILVYTPEHVAECSTQIENNLYLPEDRKEEMKQFFVNPGEIVFPIVGTLGRAMVIKEDMPAGIINQRLAKFRIDETKIDVTFFIFLLTQCQLYKDYIYANCRGSIIVNLTKEILSNMDILLPPLAEQKKIVDYLVQKEKTIDSSIVIALRQIKLLKEYKQSLITEVVTGKRKVC